MEDNDTRFPCAHQIQTCYSNKAKVRYKNFQFILLVFIVLLVQPSLANRPPRFLIDGQTEIVLRLKEGSETPVGKFSTIFIIIMYIDTENTCLLSFKIFLKLVGFLDIFIFNSSK